MINAASLPHTQGSSVTQRPHITRVFAEATPEQREAWAFAHLASQERMQYARQIDPKYPWLSDPEWTSPLLEHRGGHYYGGPVDWATGRSA